MAKEKVVYVCSECGQESPRWIGKCPSCGAWNTFKEEIIRKEPVSKRPLSGMEPVKSKPLVLDDIEGGDEPRIDMNDEELNRRRIGAGLIGFVRWRTGYRKVHLSIADRSANA